MKRPQQLITALAALLLALCIPGCGGYAPPAQGGPLATLHIVNHLPHLNTTGWRYYPDPECKSTTSASLGAFSALYDQEKRVQVAAGQTRYLFVETWATATGKPVPGCPSGTVCIAQARCRVMFEMTPLAGHTYRAEHFGTGESCRVELTDAATGRQPAEVRAIPVPASCKR